MFLDDAVVLHRHEPAGEWHDLRAEPRVLIVKRRAFLCGFAHGPSLDFAIGLRNAAASMTWLDKLERRFGFLGVPGLMRIVVGFTALVWTLVWLNPDFRFALDLDPTRVRNGEVWRLVTYIFLPQTFSFW